jgi:RNA recognition motif-containing protein
LKLYVGNLDYSSTSEDVKNAFAQFGGVESAEVIMDRNTGRSKGFGFVEMSNDDEARAAIAGLDGKNLDGRLIKVNEARPRTDRPRPPRY